MEANMGKKTYQKRGNPFYYRGSWNIEYYEYDASGIKKRRRKAGFTLENDAKEALEKQRLLLGKWENVPENKTDILFWHYMKTWFYENYVKRIQPETARTYEYTLKLLQAKLDSNALLYQLDRPTIERLLIYYANETPGYVKSIKDLLYACCENAVQCGVIGQNPASNVHMPQIIKTPPYVMTQEEFLYLLKLAEGTSTYLEFLLAMLMGLTKQDIFELQYEDIDFELGLMKIRTGNTRILTLPQEVLEQLRRREKQSTDSGYMKKYVSCQSNGSKRSGSCLNTALKKLTEKAGLPHIPFRNLRDSMAFILLKNGFELLTVSRLFGYVSYKTAEDRFGYLRELVYKRNPDSFNCLFGKVV